MVERKDKKIWLLTMISLQRLHLDLNSLKLLIVDPVNSYLSKIFCGQVAKTPVKEKMFSQIANYPSVFLSVETREVSGQTALSFAKS